MFSRSRSFVDICVSSVCFSSRRHGRACPGHPRNAARLRFVDGRDKPGHDATFELPSHAMRIEDNMRRMEPTPALHRWRRD